MKESDNGWVRAFAPATVANVGCGFDVFGFAIAKPGDVVAARRRDEPGVVLGEITGDGGRLRDLAKNTAAVAAEWLLENAVRTTGQDPGVELRLEKGLPLASGLGSSAASAVAAVVAVDALLGLGLPRETLLAAAVEGERAASGSPHADNAAPGLYGGFVLVRSGRAHQVVELPVPHGLSCALVRPHIEIETGASRRLLGDTVGLREAVVQWGNVGAFVAGLFRSDLELLASALHDAVAEPVRGPRVPGFQAMKEAARRAGALGCSLSGSGPATFALCTDLESAQRVAAAMAAALPPAETCDVYVSEVGAAGARTL